MKYGKSSSSEDMNQLNTEMNTTSLHDYPDLHREASRIHSLIKNMGKTVVSKTISTATTATTATTTKSKQTSNKTTGISSVFSLVSEESSSHEKDDCDNDDVSEDIDTVIKTTITNTDTTADINDNNLHYVQNIFQTWNNLARMFDSQATARALVAQVCAVIIQTFSSLLLINFLHYYCIYIYHYTYI
jgi:hypothetical protein